MSRLRCGLPRRPASLYVSRAVDGLNPEGNRKKQVTIADIAYVASGQQTSDMKEIAASSDVVRRNSLRIVDTQQHGRLASSSSNPSRERPRSMILTPKGIASVLSAPPTQSVEASIPRSSSIALPQHPPSRRPISGSSAHPTASKPATHRPQFSTFQQHFTPKKSWKARTKVDEPATHNQSLYPPRPHVVALQNELLQLQLIHAPSHSTLRNYQRSAESKLRARFNILAKHHHDVQATEQERLSVSSHAVYQQWMSQEGLYNATQRTQLLSQCIRELAEFTAPKSRYAVAITEFELWFKAMTTTMEETYDSSTAGKHWRLNIEPLTGDWHEAIAQLKRKLQKCEAAMGHLGTAEEGSVLCAVLRSHQSLVKNLSQELDSCSMIEKMILEQQEEWISHALIRILAEEDKVGSSAGDSRSRRGVWEISG